MLDADTHARWRDEAEAGAQALGNRYNLVALLRLICFVFLALAAAGAVKTPGPLPLAVAASCAVAFLLLALWHVHLDDGRRRARLRSEYHRRGAERVAGRWRHGQDDGSRYLDAERWHPYARDLDVVGPGSLYELLDTAGSRPGRDCLAAWLLDEENGSSKDQAALVRELGEAHRWRAELAVRSTDEHADDDQAEAEQLLGWLAAPPPAPGRVFTIGLWVLRVVGPLIAVAGFLAFGAGTGALILLAAATLLYPVDLAAGARADLGSPARARRRVLAYVHGLRQVAEAPGRHQRLDALRREAGQAADALQGLLDGLDGIAKSANILRAYLGALLLIQWSQVLRLRRWAERHGADYPRWCALLGEGEALACLATYAAEQGGCWPECSQEGPAFAAEGLSHPLLPRSSRVGNDLVLEDGQVLLLTGANASGKSTFLRSCCLAQLLARIGAPVPAIACRLRPMRLATVMRVHDDLLAGRSRFQAEVQRLRQVLDLAEAGDPPCMLALDEILGGTNSRERHLGTQAVLDHLRGKHGLVLVSTHDLELARLAEREPERIVCAHFADRADVERSDEGRPDMVFDYRLRPGVLQTTNALRVMRAFGLPVQESEKRE